MIDSWNHLMCWVCWVREHPGRVPFRLKGQPKELCCFCGKPTISGIYVRRDPRIVHPGMEARTE